MTQLFADDGTVTPVTVVEAGPCVVTQLRTAERDGYHAVLAVHAEGSLEAEKLQMLRSYTANHAPAAIAYARKLAGLG